MHKEHPSEIHDFLGALEIGTAMVIVALSLGLVASKVLEIKDHPYALPISALGLVAVEALYYLGKYDYEQVVDSD